MTFKILRNFEQCRRTENTLPLSKAKEAQDAVNREKGRETTTFCSIMSFQYFCVTFTT